MALRPPTIVILDMDGTTVRHLSPAVLALAEKYDDLSYTISKFFDWIFRRQAKGPMIPAKEKAELERRRRPRLLVHKTIHWLRRNKEVDQMVEPCPGIYEFLELLKEKEIPAAMVSNGLGRGYGHDILKKFDLNKFFYVKLFRENIKKSKPHPDSILKAVQKLEEKLERVFGEDDVIWYIGDRRKDVLAAMAAQSKLPCTIQPIGYAVNSAAAIIEKGLPPAHIMVDYHVIARTVLGLLNAQSDKTKAGEEKSSATQRMRTGS